MTDIDTDQLQFNFPPSDTQTKWRLGLYVDDVRDDRLFPALFDSFEEAVARRKDFVRTWTKHLNSTVTGHVVWEDTARGTGWFGVKNVPGESTSVYALFITKA